MRQRIFRRYHRVFTSVYIHDIMNAKNAFGIFARRRLSLRRKRQRTFGRRETKDLRRAKSAQTILGAVGRRDNGGAAKKQIQTYRRDRKNRSRLFFLPVAEKRGKSFPFCHKIGVRRGVKGDRLKAETEQRLRSAGKHGEHSCGGKTVKVSNMKSRKRGAE